MSDKIALITGATGQDGAYLGELLLKKGYVVHGVKRRSSSLNTQRVDHLYVDPHVESAKFFLHYGDMTDATNLIRLRGSQPTKSQSCRAKPCAGEFETLHRSRQCRRALQRFLGAAPEAIRILRMEERARLDQPSSSELYGEGSPLQNAETLFVPRSP